MKRYDKKTEQQLREAARAIRGAGYLTAFTGAGISVESGVPPFRGTNGIWNRYDPKILELDYFSDNPESCWPVIHEIFYEHFGKASPNAAHRVLAQWEKQGLLQVLITQNIDDLHYKAGSRRVIEFHGNSRHLLCTSCGNRYEVSEIDLTRLPPRCTCGAILKPDFVFFGEGIPPQAMIESERAAGRTDVMLVIGTTGEVYPAASLPRAASSNGAIVIEINPERSLYSDEISDIVIRLPAGEAMSKLDELLTE